MSKAETEYIGKNTPDSHQISPHWLVTFTRFNNRDTQNYKKGTINNIKSADGTRRPLIVENDCVTVSVSTNKTNKTPSTTIVLAAGDLNYATAISPGDFVMINMVNSSEKARQLRIRAGNEQSINRKGDGFKGIFKINSVGQIIHVDPSSGIKTLRYQVTAYGFTEWDNSIYFNPTLGESVSKDVMTYIIGLELLTVLSSKKDLHKVMGLLPGIILGSGSVDTLSGNAKKTPYKIPKSVFKLMGIKKGGYAIDLYKVMIGVWGNTTNFDPATTSTKQLKNIQVTSSPLEGKIPIQTTSLVNVRLIDLMKRFSNEMINETYSCFRLDSKTNKILPKLIIRQKPFNSEQGVLTKGEKEEKKSYKTVKGTKFLSLPRWKISSDLIYSINISKNESLRFNLVHIIGTTGISHLDQTIMAVQNADNSTVVRDDIDISRHGLKPYTQTSNFDWATVKKGHNTLSQGWAHMVFDWVNGGHLKTNGTIQTVGIEEDICIGDNLELQDTVYHIESINHIGSISPDGRKSFRTTMTLSHGVDKRSNANGPVYPQMDYTDTLLDRQHDYDENYGIMPGFSDTQDILGRTDGEETKETGNAKYTPYKLRKKSDNPNKDEN